MRCCQESLLLYFLQFQHLGEETKIGNASAAHQRPQTYSNSSNPISVLYQFGDGVMLETQLKPTVAKRADYCLSPSFEREADACLTSRNLEPQLVSPYFTVLNF